MEAGEGIIHAMPKVPGHANRWRLHGYWMEHGTMPQVIRCRPEEPLHCENRVVYKTTKKQTRPRTQVCGAALTYNSSELRGPTEVDGVPTFFMIEVHSCPDCARRRRADPSFTGQVHHRILTADMVKYRSHLSGVYEDIILEGIEPGRTVALPFSEEHACRLKRQFKTLIAQARAFVSALCAPVLPPFYNVPAGVRRDRRDSGREQQARSVAYAQAFTARRPGAPLMRGWYSRLLQFFADVNGDGAAVPG
ncbi:hypothetical protein [Eubacterium sp. 1001713B170207_170306_E7]|uniref:hypothetical protein n=1 Tax=Eubacterium sp. 1001713B170207_170306_E7 TaxID=2787097 RepID=UPI001897FE93|nr:hypothetical protein [Eubacterium sp. 1001713B170207_170306_E7]